MFERFIQVCKQIAMSSVHFFLVKTKFRLVTNNCIIEIFLCQMFQVNCCVVNGLKPNKNAMDTSILSTEP